MLRALLLLVLLSACDAPAVEWSDPVVLRVGADQRLILDSAGNPSAVPEPSIASSPPLGSRICASSWRVARGTGGLHGAWWAVRQDSAAILYAAVSTDSGRSWGVPVAVDTLDRSSRGCNRPPPALAMVGDDLQLAYSMIAPEGTGVFYAHFMGAMLHSPVAVIYGDRIVATAIAADSDLVAVAYEEPNGSRSQVDVALSSTQGHIFETHETASRGVDVAAQPTVALSGHRIAVAWWTREPGDTAASRVVRVGRLP